MVQITFAFVIILGYLVSAGLDETNKLTAQAKLHQQQKKLVETLLADLRGTELGESQAARVAAEKDLQWERLRAIWAERRGKRPLNSLMQRYGGAEVISLSDDLDCLPTLDSFQELNRELRRVFLVEGQSVSQQELIRLMTDVLTEAGHELTDNRFLFDPDQFGSETEELYFDPDMPTRENLDKLKSKITADLEDERRQWAVLQYILVGKIAVARRDKLAERLLSGDFALDQQEILESGEATGAIMLERVLEDLKTKMMLLPETVRRIRETTRAE